MTKLDQVFEKVRQLPQKQQEEVIQVVENMTSATAEFTATQREKIDRGLAQADAGEFVPIKDVETFFLISAMHEISPHA